MLLFLRRLKQNEFMRKKFRDYLFYAFGEKLVATIRDV